MSGLVRPSTLIAAALALAACSSSTSPTPAVDNLTQATPPEIEDVSSDGLTLSPNSIHDRESMGAINNNGEDGR
ncbi:hypothetical protein ACFB49_09590 [Sphingomonas sp. DBB INV C78]|uniref:hypothetical protein n=1 Tax=Sphingomonas sp. DBB INV C78 TaxID=3349434 RepID=UPI0036D351B5